MSKMNNLSGGITIDTNVFEDLCSSEKNPENHIQILLDVLQSEGVGLIIDGGGRIIGEYQNRLAPRRNFPSNSHRLTLKYWLKDCRKREVKVNQGDDLMGVIKRSIPPRGGDKTADRIFVYVAIREGSILITNDRKDIIDEGNKEYQRRDRILREAKKVDKGKTYKRARIWVSKEAYSQMIIHRGGRYELNND